VPLSRERVEVERVAVNRIVEQAPAVRTEGDVTIIPVLEEVLVVEKRLMLREEVRLVRRREETREQQTVTLRKEEVEVTRDEIARDDAGRVPQK
jgi:stress response protein YsnF